MQIFEEVMDSTKDENPKDRYEWLNKTFAFFP